MSDITITDKDECCKGAHVSSDNEEDDYTSQDTCSATELSNTFKEVYKISDQKSIGFTNAYILHMCNDDSFRRIAVGLSNTQVRIFDINTKKTTFTATCNDLHLENANSTQESICISGVRYLDKTGDTLLVAATDGSVRLFDCRAAVEQQAVYEINNKKFESIPKNFLCFDRNSNSRMLCVGTEEKGSFAYLLFFDIRDQKILGAYYEGHSSDITSLRFHPDNPDILTSGSIDGLINIYNLEKAKEQQALLVTMNTNNSVDRLFWHKNVYGQDVISCITHTAVKIYESVDGNNIIDMERDELSKAMKRSTFHDFNIINTHSMLDGGIFLLAGTNTINGNVLRSLKLENRQALPLANFMGNKQIVRDSLYNEKVDILATGGESAIVTLWSPASKQEQHNTTTTLKVKSDLKSKRIKVEPY